MVSNTFDKAAIHAHVEILHRLAAGLDGVLVLACYGENPHTGRETSSRVMQFGIGDVDYMVDAIMTMESEPHLNIYCAPVVYQRSLARRSRGETRDIVKVLALVADMDHDSKKAGTLPLAPHYMIESSAGNFQPFYVFASPLDPQRAHEIAQALGYATGGDHGTKDINHIWRVPGTLNWPNRVKVKGSKGHKARSPDPQPVKAVLPWDGNFIGPDQLLAACGGPRPAEESREAPKGRTGKIDATVEEIVAEPGSDRSSRFFDACRAARAARMLPDDLEDLMRQHPNGCAAKYLKPDRLRKEIDRAWTKLSDRNATDPTYAEDIPSNSPRERIAQRIEAFLDRAAVWNTEVEHGDRLDALNSNHAEWVPAEAICTPTGSGKTRIAAKIIANRRIKGAVYAVPRHQLGEEVVGLFHSHGVTAARWRGRKAFVSGRSGPKMCGNLEVVKIAEEIGATVETACCKGKNNLGVTVKCPLYETCEYQKQKKAKPDVWLVAHATLFQAVKAIGDVSVVFIDENFVKSAIRKDGTGVTLDQLDHLPLGKFEVTGELEPHRRRLARALRSCENGGVPRTALIAAGLTVDNCAEARKLEWHLLDDVEMWPGIKPDRRKAGNVKHVRAMHGIWRAAEEILACEGDAVSGRLYLPDAKTDEGKVRVVRTRGIREIAKQFRVPTFLMDATLPDEIILKKWFPEIRVVDRITVPTPHATVRQVLGAPITVRKLTPEKDGPDRRALHHIRRYVLQKWIETGRGEVLLVVQKEVENILNGLLPSEISVRHFNDLAGLDAFKHVRLLITVGRTQPRPFDMEDEAGALSGIESVKAPVQANGGTWFERVERGIRLKNGSGVAVLCDQHPDPLAEALRWQACEAELIQAIGRGRAVNRTVSNPLDINILADVVLPVTVDQVSEWSPPGQEWEMAAEGVWLTSPTDMAKAWPKVWADVQAAKDWLRTNRVEFPLRESFLRGIPPCSYQLSGPKQKWKSAYFDLDVVPDPGDWLAARLGPLAGFKGPPTSPRPVEFVLDGEEARIVLEFFEPDVEGRVSFSVMRGVE